VFSFEVRRHAAPISTLLRSTRRSGAFSFEDASAGMSADALLGAVDPTTLRAFCRRIRPQDTAARAAQPLSPQRRRAIFLPADHSGRLPRETTRSLSAILRCAAGLTAACRPSRGLVIAVKAAMVAGLRQQMEIIMAQIGSFTRGEDGVFIGAIRTLSLRAVTIGDDGVTAPANAHAPPCAHAIHDRSERFDAPGYSVRARGCTERRPQCIAVATGAAAFLHVGGEDTSANREAINASEALNRPRRSSGGTTASTASSFSEGSIGR
jgi:hypothetical protein